MSSHEVWLWSRLKRLRERGFHIRRQVPYKGFFLDFACLPLRIAIEVDGSQHQDEVQVDHDLVRDKILAREGFTTLRFTTGQINENIGAVMDTIIFELEARRDSPTRPPASRPSTLP